jgi:RNA polymerase sigma-70 factor, ECF subfamily
LQSDSGSDIVRLAVQREAVQGRDELAAIYERHADGVRRTALAVVRDRALAEDVTQEVFLALWLRPERFDPERGSYGSLLRVMARSRALDQVRRGGAARRAHDRLEAEPETGTAQPDDPADVVTDVIRAARLRRAVRDLPSDQREAIALAYWGGMTAEQVARRNGIPHGTAKSRIRIGLTKLRRDLAD